MVPTVRLFDHSCAPVSQGVFVAEGQFKADMAWQIVLVHTDVDGVEGSPAAPSGAAQPAGRQEVAQVFVVIGNAHIVCGKKPTPNLVQKKCIVNEFLAFLGAIEGPDNETQRPVVRLLVGDTNISYDVARECAAEAVPPADAQKVLDRWVPVSTTNKLSGDVMWCCGAFACEMAIPIGKKLREE